MLKWPTTVAEVTDNCMGYPTSTRRETRVTSIHRDIKAQNLMVKPGLRMTSFNVFAKFKLGTCILLVEKNLIAKNGYGDTLRELIST